MTNGEKIKAILKPRTDQIKIYSDWLEIEIQSLGINFSCELKWWNEEREDKRTPTRPAQETLAIERYQDLVDYFDDKDVAKTILGSREGFKQWLARMKWHVEKADELARKLDQKPCEDAISRKSMLDYLKYLY